MQGKFEPVLAWLVLAAPISPFDCFLKIGTGHSILFQKKGSNTRKNLIQNLIKSGVIEFDTPQDQYRHYIDLVEQVMESTFIQTKMNQFRTQNQHHHLLLPVKARLPHGVQVMMKELGLTLENPRGSIPLPPYPSENDLIKILFEDIDLASATLDREPDNSDKLEIESLKRKNLELTSQVEQLTDAAKNHEADIAKYETDLRKSFDEQTKIQGQLSKIEDEFADLERKYKITKSEIEGMLEGHKDAKAIYANRVASLEKRLEEIRAESQDFKLKFAKEMDKTKEVQRSLSQAQTNLARTATALKKFTDREKKS